MGLGAASQHLPEVFDQMIKAKERNREDEALKNLGVDLSGIADPDTRQMLIKQQLMGQNEAAKAAMQMQEKTETLRPAFNALNSLESLIGSSGIGALGRMNFTDEARRNRGVFESTSAALMPLFKSMFPRGMTEKEFKFVNENYIPQVTDTEEKIRGKIQGLKSLMEGQLGLEPLSPMPESQEHISRQSDQSRSSLRSIWGMK